ncbi:MAG TPA: glutamate-1-semialdehyde 2,1-aminomutase [Spirochaetota bacterium]|nr:glutamate-1-semialdehyde 2,1-aminomutase [Spirochaetota bacterium]
MNIDRSVDLYKQACRLMPGGVNSPVRAFKSVGGYPLFMKSGSGSGMTDEDGNTYIDYCMSWGPLILGHADPDVVSAIMEAAKHGTSFGTPNRYEVEIAEMVIDRFTSIDKIRFVNSGTEATMSAIRLARGFTGRDKIIKFDGCYHGHADHLLVAGGSGLATFGTPDSDGVSPDVAKNTLVVPFNDLELLEGVMKKNRDSVAAVIMEPVPCNFGLILPDKGFLEGVRKLCDRYDVLLIFDEVINGFRLAPGGAQEYYGVKADLTTLGKIIGGGLPVGAYGGTAEIMSKVAPDGPVYQAGTLSGNPLAMTAGIATLKKLEKLDGYSLLAAKGKEFRTLMEPVLGKYAGQVLLVQLGSIFSLYFTDRKSIRTVDQVKQCDMEMFARYHRGMLERGIYLSPSGFEVGFLSTAHTGGDIEKTVGAIAETLKQIL